MFYSSFKIMVEEPLRLMNTIESRTKFMNRLNVNFIILGALKEQKSTLTEIKQYATGQEYLAGIDLPSHLSRLENAYFIEAVKKPETNYKLLDRGKKVLKEYSTSGGIWGLGSFIRGQILEIDGISTSVIIKSYEILFGIPKKGKRKTDKKREIINGLESMRKSEELEFSNGGWHYKKPK